VILVKLSAYDDGSITPSAYNNLNVISAVAADPAGPVVPVVPVGPVIAAPVGPVTVLALPVGPVIAAPVGPVTPPGPVGPPLGPVGPVMGATVVNSHAIILTGSPFIDALFNTTVVPFVAVYSLSNSNTPL
jgi:hypothetical protein